MIAREEKPKYPKAEAVTAAHVLPNQPAVIVAAAPGLPPAAQPIFAVAAKPEVAHAAPVSTSRPAAVVNTTPQKRTPDTIPIQTTAVPARLAARGISTRSVPAKQQTNAVAPRPAAANLTTTAGPPQIPAAPSVSVTVQANATRLASNEAPPKADPVLPKTPPSPSNKPNNTVAPPVSTQLSPPTKPTKPQVAIHTEQSSSVSQLAKAPPVVTTKKVETSIANGASNTEMTNSHLNDRRISLAAAPQPISFTGDSAFVKLADGFDFPVGKPEAQGYYKARGFRSHGHLGEDWDGVGGGDTDLGDPIYVIGDGVVVFARDCHMGWGNVVIVRHSYREGGSIKTIDSLYGHLNSILVKRGQAVVRGQKIATLGNAHGLYDAHLHLEVRKNLEIGMSRAAFARDFSNYYDPSQFILSHRHLSTSGGTYRVAMNTFTHDARINWDNARNFSHAHTGGGTGESAVALKRALAEKR